MGNFIRKSWTKVIFFGVILAVYIAGVAPDMTWMSLGGDAPDYVASAQSFGGAFMIGYPSYIMTGWLFERLPFNPFWNLGLLSALSTVATSVFIFLIVRFLVGPVSIVAKEGKKMGRQIAPYIGAATYAGAFIVWSQSVIPEVYTFATLLAVAATYFVFKKKYWIASGVLAFSLGTHPLVVLAIVPLLGYIYYKERSRKLIVGLVGVGSLGLLLYLQVLLTSAESGISPSWRATFFIQSLGVLGALPIDPFQSTLVRTKEALTVLLVSFGLAIPLLFYLRRNAQVFTLALIAILGLVLYYTSFIPHWITYTTFSTAFIGVLVGVGAARFPYRRLLPVFLIIPMLLLGLNLYSYDIGRSVDPTPTSMRETYMEFEALPDNSIVASHTWGHVAVVGSLYEKNEGRGIVTVDVTNFMPTYDLFCEAKGVNMPERPETWEFGSEEEFSRRIAEANPGRSVYVAYLKETDPVLHFGLIPVEYYRNSLNAISRSP